MAVKLIYNILTLFFGDNGCKKDKKKSPDFIMRDIISKNVIFDKMNWIIERKREKMLWLVFLTCINYMWAVLLQPVWFIYVILCIIMFVMSTCAMTGFVLFCILIYIYCFSIWRKSSLKRRILSDFWLNLNFWVNCSFKLFLKEVYSVFFQLYCRELDTKGTLNIHPQPSPH